MELVRKQIHTNQMGSPVTGQFYIDDDYNVPDNKNDMARIVLAKGVLKAEEIRRMENYVKVSGKLKFAVLYETDEGEPTLASLEGDRPFEETIYIEGEEPCALLESRVEFNASMIHSRKLNIKAMAELVVSTERLKDVALTMDAEGEESLYKKQKDVQILKLHTSKKDTYRIKEEFAIPGTKENIGVLLFTDISGRKLDTRLGKGELLLSGELSVFCFYESGEGKMDWVEQTVPYNGRVECSGVEEGMFHHVYAALEEANAEVKPDEDGEMRLLGIEGTLKLRITVYEEESLKILEDAYSLRKECRLEKKEEQCEELMLQNHSKCKLTEQLSIPELKEDVLQICYNNGELQVDKTEPRENGLQIEGVLHLCILYVKENDEIPFDVWQGMVPFSYLVECENMPKDGLFDIQHTLEQLSVSLLGSGEVEVKAALSFQSLIRKPVNIQVITEMEMEDLSREGNAKSPGIIGYTVKEGEELWDLAKRYRTTIEGIKEVNKLENDVIKEGERILIFKENMSIL